MEKNGGKKYILMDFDALLDRNNTFTVRVTYIEI